MISLWFLSLCSLMPVAMMRVHQSGSVSRLSSVVMHPALHSAYLFRCHSAFHTYTVAVESMVMSYISVVTAAVVVAAVAVVACLATAGCYTWR